MAESTGGADVCQRRPAAWVRAESSDPGRTWCLRGHESGIHVDLGQHPAQVTVSAG